jgi:mannosylglycoprotein endo-beta-mannosidase
LEELKQSVWDCDGSKGPGPDGFNFKFYRLAWNFIADDLLDLAKNFFKTGRLPKGVNHAYIHLIPKTASPVGFKDFRPISLIHIIYKIIAKVLSSRLKAVMHDLISENQTAFLTGRQIIDGFLVANEAVHSLKRYRVPSLIFKVDFHKAFDSVQWDYLEQVMRHMGFGENGLI